MHDTPLPECQVNWKAVEQHHAESIGVRSQVDKSAQQILTIEKAHESVMQDIRDIKADITDIKASLKDVQNDIKVWVLGGLIGGIVIFSIPTMTLIYSSAQRDKQIEVNSSRLNAIEEMHPRVSK